VATFKESLYKVTIKIKVGNVVKSVGLGIYKDNNKINTETDKEIVRKKSKKVLGNGTIIIKSIENTKITTPISVTSLINFSVFLTLFIRFHPYNIS